MRQILSRIFVVMFFGFVLLILICCVLLIINNSQNLPSRNSISAVVLEQPDTQKENPPATEVSDTITAVETTRRNYGFSSLTTSQERILYGKLSQSVYSITDEQTAQGFYSTERVRMEGEELSEETIRHTLNAYLSDNPQVFWLQNLFGYAYSNGDTIVECYSVISAEDCTTKMGVLQHRMDELLEGISGSEDPYTCEKLLHDRLLSQCTYNSEVKSTADGWQYFTAYGAMINGEAVCEGYAKSMQLLLNRVGIPSYTIRGTADGVEHMWNLVQLDNSWYHLDATWDDSGDNIGYEYFNVSTEVICYNHTIAPKMDYFGSGNAQETESRNFFVPECTSDAMNYYTVDGITISVFDVATDHKVTDYIVHRVEQGEVYLPLKLSGALSYEDYVNKLFYSFPYKFYYFLESANEQLNGRYVIDKDSIKLLKNEKNGTVRVTISYQ